MRFPRQLIKAQCEAAGALTGTRRRRGTCAARSGHSHRGHYLWCRCIRRDIWAASLSVRPPAPGWPRPPTPGASILLSILPARCCPGVPFLLSRPRLITPACTCNFHTHTKPSRSESKGFKEENLFDVFVLLMRSWSSGGDGARSDAAGLVPMLLASQ